jgi:methylenetetrahydrofolate dehydrogenase (NADP+)/methenyltetrahydrofolate cyclohydrolase
MAIVINGQELAEKIKDEVVKEIISLNQGEKRATNKRPNLAIIMVGKREDSEIYVNLKEREAKKVGIDTHIYKCDVNVPEREIFEMIDCLNKDELIDAILVQLPLPDGYDTDGIIQAIDPKKDVDRFHPDNLEELIKTCNHSHVMPPLFSVVLKILESQNIDPGGKKVSILGNADIFLLGLKKVLECKKAKVVTAHANDQDLVDKIKEADILISAMGQPRFITAKMIKKDAVIIDIGINKVNGKLCGDVDFNDCEKRAKLITPVPNGVGPMTVAELFKNTLALYKARRGV